MKIDLYIVGAFSASEKNGVPTVVDLATDGELGLEGCGAGLETRQVTRLAYNEDWGRDLNGKFGK